MQETVREIVKAIVAVFFIGVLGYSVYCGSDAWKSSSRDSLEEAKLASQMPCKDFNKVFKGK